MTLRFDLLTLQLFVAVVDEQNIAKAAKKNHIAVSAVSRRISDLEAMLQLDLLHRYSTGIQPTPAGYVLLEQARIILGNLTHLEAQLAAHRQGMHGHVRLFVNTSATLESLTQDLSVFLAAHPSVEVELEECTSPSIIQAIIENKADIGIFGGNISAPDVQIFPYREDRLVAVVAAGHVLATRPSVRFADLIDYDFVSVEKGSSIDSLCARAAEDLGRPLRPRIRVGGFDVMFGMVGAKGGVGVAPKEVVEPWTRSNSGVVMIVLDEPWTRRSLVLGVRDRASLPPATMRLLDYLRYCHCRS